MGANIPLETTLETLFTQVISEYPHLFFLGLKKDNKQTLFTFLVDGDEAVTLKEITKLSKTMSFMVDETLPENAIPFRMEVSTPGADKPLLHFRQYPKHIGRTLKIKTTEANYEGKLLAANEKSITIEPKAIKKSKTKTTVAEEVGDISIPFANITEAKIIISFK